MNELQSIDQENVTEETTKACLEKENTPDILLTPEEVNSVTRNTPVELVYNLSWLIEQFTPDFMTDRQTFLRRCLVHVFSM